MIEYRRAEVSDIDELARIRIDFLSETKGISGDELRATLYKSNWHYMTELMNNGSFVSWLAVEDGNIIATSGVTFYVLMPNATNPTGRAAYISNMFTYPQYRKRGIASKLLSMVVNEARERGHVKLTLNATAMGRPIYEKFGFTDMENEMVYRAK